MPEGVLYYFLRNAKQNPEWVQNNLIQFISYQNDRAKRGEISVSTIPNYYRATKLFCEMNDIDLGWKKIAPDRRIKPIVYSMVSSGIRIGAWDYLQWKHVSPMINAEGDIVAARLLVYAGEAEEYYSFITQEAYNSLKDWMDFRSSYGENISGESWFYQYHVWRI